jgi:hypothetical protein
MSSFSTLPDARFRSSSGQSPTPSGITQGLDGLSLAVEGPSNNTADGIAQLMAIAGGAANAVQDAGQIAARRAQYESQLEFEVAQRAQDVQTLAMRKAEQERREGKQADQAADAQYERFVARERVGKKSLATDLGNVELLRLTERIDSGDQQATQILNGSFDERLVYARDVAASIFSSADASELEDDKAEYATRVLQLINGKRDNIIRDAESAELQSAAAVMAQAKTPSEFADVQNVMRDGAIFATDDEVIATTTLPALQFIASTADVPKLNAFIEASGLAGNERYATTLQTLRNTAEANAIKLRSARQSQNASDLRLAIVGADIDPQNTSLYTLRSQFNTVLRAGGYDDREAAELNNTLSRAEERQAKESEKQLIQSFVDNQRAAIIDESLNAVTTGGGFALGDAVILVPNLDGSTEKTITITREQRIQEVMPSALAMVETTAKASGLTQSDIYRKQYSLAASVRYVPDTVKQQAEQVYQVASDAVAKGGDLQVNPLLEDMMVKYRAMSPAYREVALTESQILYFGAVDELMKLPGMTLETAARNVASYQNNNIELRRATESAIDKKVGESVNRSTIANKIEPANWISRRAKNYAMLGNDATKATDKAIKEFDEMSGKVNGYTVPYAKTYAPAANQKEFPEALGEYLRVKIFPAIKQAKPTFLGEEISIDQLVPMIDPNSNTVQLRFAGNMMPVFADSTDTFAINDVYTWFANRKGVNDAITQQKVIAEQQMRQENTARGVKSSDIYAPFPQD